ncbi:MAG: hypothetical protein IV100_11130 [Myxococcales bacterium]|nr:hypothetical protein [Myxococcales bacterium]
MSEPAIIPPPQPGPPDARPAERRCDCGFTRDHPKVEASPKYKWHGWVLLMMGSTPTPERVLFRCTVCRRSLGASTDPAVLRRHM